MDALSGSSTQRFESLEARTTRKAELLKELHSRVNSAYEEAQKQNEATLIPSMTHLHHVSRNAWVRGDVRSTLQNVLKSGGSKDRQLTESKLVSHDALTRGIGDTIRQEVFSNDAVTKKMTSTFTANAFREFGEEKLRHILPHAQIEEFGAVATFIDTFNVNTLGQLVSTVRELNDVYKAFNGSADGKQVKIPPHQQVIFNYDPTNSEHLRDLQKLKAAAVEQGFKIIDVFTHEGLKTGAVALEIEENSRFPIGLPSGANVVVFSGKNEVLLVLDKAKGAWMFPGGKVEEHQNHVQAAMAELEQEAGIAGNEISERDLISAKAFPHHQMPGGTRCPALNKIYGIYIDHLDPEQLEHFDREEISEVRLVSLEELKGAKQLADQKGASFNLSFDVQGVAKSFHDSKMNSVEDLLQTMKDTAATDVQKAEKIIEDAKAEVMQSNAEFLRTLKGN